ERHGSGLSKGPLRLRTTDLTAALEIIRIGGHGHLGPRGELLGIADQTGEETTLSVKNLNTAPVPGVRIPRTDIDVTRGVHCHVSRIRQRRPLRARAADLGHKLTIAGEFLHPMALVIS